ncbi:MAG TPA: cytidine deaminase [Saprospiraceae bacterium]|nr:cytidine deaminase [Saprospiraceae bacterium]
MRKIFNFIDFRMKDLEYFTHLEDLDAESKYLTHKAKEAAAHAYAPYSKFCVGAALILDDGSIVSGANQENAAYPLCMCAERVTLYAASAQHPEKKIVKLAVVAHKKNHKDLTPASFCGSCRQVLVEFETRQHKPIELIMLGPDKRWVKAPSAVSLLPFSFSKDSLDA